MSSNGQALLEEEELNTNIIFQMDVKIYAAAKQSSRTTTIEYLLYKRTHILFDIMRVEISAQTRAVFRQQTLLLAHLA